jgi:hypothetical protein
VPTGTQRTYRRRHGPVRRRGRLPAAAVVTLCRTRFRRSGRLSTSCSRADGAHGTRPRSGATSGSPRWPLVRSQNGGGSDDRRAIPLARRGASRELQALITEIHALRRKVQRSRSWQRVDAAARDRHCSEFGGRSARGANSRVSPDRLRAPNAGTDIGRRPPTTAPERHGGRDSPLQLSLHNDGYAPVREAVIGRTGEQLAAARGVRKRHRITRSAASGNAGSMAFVNRLIGPGNRQTAS